MTSTAAAAAASTSPPPPPPPLFLPGDDDLLFSSGPGTDSASCLAALNSSLEWILQEPPPCLPLHPDAFISSLCSAVDSFLRFRRRPVNLLSIIAGCVDDGVDTLEAESLDRRVLAFYHWLLLKEKTWALNSLGWTPTQGSASAKEVGDSATIIYIFQELITVPALLDLVALYGLSAQETVQAILAEAFIRTPALGEDLSASLGSAADTLMTLVSSLAGFGDDDDALTFLWDTIYSILALVKTLPRAIGDILGSHGRKSETCRKGQGAARGKSKETPQDRRRGSGGAEGVINFVQAIIQVYQGKLSSLAAANDNHASIATLLRNTVLELVVWCIVASVRDNKQASSSALDLLVTAIESVADRDTMDKVWSRMQGITSAEDMGLSKASRMCLDQVVAARRGRGLGLDISGSAEESSAAEKQILEMLPHVGIDSVRKALRDCSGDIDKAVDMLLTAPPAQNKGRPAPTPPRQSPSVSSLPWSSKAQKPVIKEQRNPFPPLQAIGKTAQDITSKLHRASNPNTVLGQGASEESKAWIQQRLETMEYDDEYDDSFDEFAELDMNEGDVANDREKKAEKLPPLLTESRDKPSSAAAATTGGKIYDFWVVGERVYNYEKPGAKRISAVSIAAATAEAARLAQVEREQIHGLGRGGNKAAFASSSRGDGKDDQVGNSNVDASGEDGSTGQRQGAQGNHSHGRGGGGRRGATRGGRAGGRHPRHRPKPRG